MTQFLAFCAALLLGQVTALCQSNSPIAIEGTVLVVIYMSENETSLVEKWKLEEDETVAIQDMLQIQNDVFGKIEYPKTYKLNESFSKKFTVSTLEFEDLFSNDPSAQMEFKVYKGKKKKHPYKIQEVSIASSSETLEPFMDSLCAPYVDLIITNQTDSLIELAFQTKELKESLELLKEDASKKDLEKAENIYAFMMFVRGMIKDELKQIDTNEKPAFERCDLTLKTGKPVLNVRYLFQGKNEKRIHCTFSFELKDGVYQLSSIGAGTESKSRF